MYELPKCTPQCIEAKASGEHGKTLTSSGGQIKVPAIISFGEHFHFYRPIFWKKTQQNQDVFDMVQYSLNFLCFGLAIMQTITVSLLFLS